MGFFLLSLSLFYRCIFRDYEYFAFFRYYFLVETNVSLSITIDIDIIPRDLRNPRVPLFAWITELHRSLSVSKALR